MDLNKHLDFFNPRDYAKPIHIIGVGAVGSRIAEQLVRLGFNKLHIYDLDIVEPINIPNQLYVTQDVGELKVDALERLLKEINPMVDIVKSGKAGYTSQQLGGAVFLAVDSINLRRKIATNHQLNQNIDIMFDVRMRLTDAQAYAALWNTRESRNIFLNTMKFSDADAEKATPVSACNTTLSVVSTVVVLASVTVTNFINFIQGKPISNVTLMDPFDGMLDTTTY